MHKLTLIAVTIGILIGCAASQIAPVRRADAELAAPGTYRECAIYMLNYDGDADDIAGVAKPLPAGWTPIGGSGGSGASKGVVLCR
jgi:hypothetical protein